MYIRVNVDFDSWSQCQTQDTQYRIDQKVTTLLQVKRHRICVLLCVRKVKFFVSINKSSYWIKLNKYCWKPSYKPLLYSHTKGDQRTGPILDMLHLSSLGHEFCHPLKCPDLMPPDSYIWVHSTRQYFSWSNSNRIYRRQGISQTYSTRSKKNPSPIGLCDQLFIYSNCTPFCLLWTSR